jgi:ADP-heptose:LPS heptosyltransferase
MISLKRFNAHKQGGSQSATTGGFSKDDVLAMAAEAKRNRKHALAILYYEKAMEIWGDHPDYWMDIALLQRGMERYRDARESIAKAIRLDPKNAQFQLELAELHLAQKHYKDAEESYYHALQMKPDWALAAEKLRQVKKLALQERERERADEEERIRKDERLDMLSRSEAGTNVDPALFPSTRWELTHDHRPSFVISFAGIYQRTRWGAGPVVRGIGSLRGYILSISPYHEVEIYVDGRLVHSGGLTVGIVQNERSDARLRKYAFNAWVDFSQFSYGWHEVSFRAVGVDGSVKEGENWIKEDVIVDEVLPDGFFVEAMARVPRLDDSSPLSLVEQVRALPSVVADATPNSYPGPIKNVAVLRLDGLGDTAVSVPFFLKLRALLPEANIVVIASADNADGCRALDIFDEVIEINFPENPYRQGRFLSADDQAALIERLASYKFDLAITGMVSNGPRQLSVMTGAPVTIGFGGDDLKSLNVYYDTRDPKSGSNVLNYAARYGMLAKALEVWLDSGARVQRRNDLNRDMLTQYGLGIDDRYVVMHTGSRIKATEWPGYAALTNRIIEQLDLKVVYISNDEYQKTNLSKQGLRDGKIIFIAGIIPFDHFDAFLSYCSSFVGNDSGPGHLATLRGARAVRIISARLGGSEWKSEMAGVCIYRRLPCAGCGSIPISKPDECTYDIACVKDISVDEVFEQVVRLTSLDAPQAHGLGRPALTPAGDVA